MSAQPKAYKGVGMVGPIARWYAKNTGRNRGRFLEAAQRIEQRLPSGGAVLEVAPGPGFTAIELARNPKFRVSALDISASFIRIVREEAERSGVAIELHLGDAAHLPFGDASFDYVTCTAAFKNFSDPVGAINEFYRVLKPGGTASIVDLRSDVPSEAIAREVETMQLSPLNAALTRWTFANVLLKRAYSRAALGELLSQSRCRHSEIVDDGIGFELKLLKSA